LIVFFFCLKVTSFRKWLKTNPANEGLYEAKLSLPVEFNDSETSISSLTDEVFLTHARRMNIFANLDPHEATFPDDEEEMNKREESPYKDNIEDYLVDVSDSFSSMKETQSDEGEKENKNPSDEVSDEPTKLPDDIEIPLLCSPLVMVPLNCLISPSIFRMKIYKEWSFLVPFCNKKNFNINETEGDLNINSISSLAQLIEKSKKNKFTKSKIQCKIDGFYLMPTMFSVYVHCEICDYLNCVPFSMTELHEANIYKFITDENEEEHLETNIPPSDQVLNFDVNWLGTVTNSSFAENPATQNIANTFPNSGAVVEIFKCPRCAKNCDDSETSSQVNLKYIYRILFKMKFVENGRNIFPDIPFFCESDQALKFTDGVKASDFYVSRTKVHCAFKNIKKHFYRLYN
jgi:hypothetical protein